MFAIFVLLLKDAIFSYRPLLRFSPILNTDLKDDAYNFAVSYVSSIVLFFEITICSMLHSGDEKKVQNIKNC